MEAQKKIIVRYPPSPTGLLHVGNVRTLLFNYLFAKKNGGQIVFRLEDTDKERSKEEYANDIIDNLKWLQIEPDFATTVRQSDRTDIYKKYLTKLIEEGKAYLSKEEVTEEGQRAEVIRFKNPNTKIKFHDLIRGDIEFDTSDLKDFVIAKSLDEPIYHMAVVVDDFEMGVTHIIRGDDGISNTPRQILIQEAIGAPRPIYAHVPLVLAEDKSKLSKRKHGEFVSVSYYKKAGYLPEAMVNFLALIGWNPGTEQEIFSMEELINNFEIEKVQKKSGIFNIEKLNWINHEHLLKQDSELKIQNLKSQIAKSKWCDHPKVNDADFIQKFLLLILDRIHRWGEVSELLEAGEYDYLFDLPTYEAPLLVWKKSDKEKARVYLTKVFEIIAESENIDNAWQVIFEYAEKEGKGDVLWPLRTALSGKEKSPDPLTLINILGKEETQQRIQNALSKL